MHATLPALSITIQPHSKVHTIRIHKVNLCCKTTVFKEFHGISLSLTNMMYSFHFHQFLHLSSVTAATDLRPCWTQLMSPARLIGVCGAWLIGVLLLVTRAQQWDQLTQSQFYSHPESGGLLSNFYSLMSIQTLFLQLLLSLQQVSLY